MAAVKWNQDVNAGQDWMADINLLLSNGNPRDITKHTMAGQIKRHYKSVNIKENITVRVMDFETGNVRLMLSAVQTSNLKFGKWLYDVELTDRRGSYVTLTGDGSGAEAVATVAADNTISAITVTKGGSGYTTATVAIEDTRVDGNGASIATGTGATATATIEGGVVTAITVTNGGSNYILQIKDRIIEGVFNVKPEITIA